VPSGFIHKSQTYSRVYFVRYLVICVGHGPQSYIHIINYNIYNNNVKPRPVWRNCGGGVGEQCCIPTTGIIRAAKLYIIIVVDVAVVVIVVIVVVISIIIYAYCTFYKTVGLFIREKTRPRAVGIGRYRCLCIFKNFDNKTYTFLFLKVCNMYHVLYAFIF